VTGDGGRDRASIGVEGWQSSQKYSGHRSASLLEKAFGVSFDRIGDMVRLLGAGVGPIPNKSVCRTTSCLKSRSSSHVSHLPPFASRSCLSSSQMQFTSSMRMKNEAIAAFVKPSLFGVPLTETSIENKMSHRWRQRASLRISVLRSWEASHRNGQRLAPATIG
jgi:hypothetical protein